MTTNTPTNNYDENSITVLKGLSAVRVRPAMYIGDTEKKGLHHCLWETLDNSVDEAMAGFCNQINVTLHADGETISVEDNGRGIPVGIHQDYLAEGKTALEVVMTILHAGGKFNNDSYAGGSGGLHGVGVSCVNALSDKLVARVWRDGGAYEQTFSRGEPVSATERVGDSRKHGTSITFHADTEIFTNGIKFDEDVIIKKIRETAFLNSGLKIVYKNLKTNREEIYQYAGGIKDYVTHLNAKKTGHYPSDPFYCSSVSGNCTVQVSFQYTFDEDERILSFANNINTLDGGTHLSGFKTALTRVANQFAKSINLLKQNDTNLSGDDIREGITAVISVRLPQPQFEGQTKAKLGSAEGETAVNSVFGEALTEYFEKNPAIFKQIIDRAMICQKARAAAKKEADAVKRKSFLGKSNRLPGKLYDCNSENVSETELFICVSGDTRIRLTDSRSLTIPELIEEDKQGKTNYTYGYNLKTGHVEIEKITNPRMTRISDLLKITLDNGKTIKVTPDHKMLLRDGKYVMACELLAGDSLMPFDTKLSEDNYELIFDVNSGIYTPAHFMADEYNIRYELLRDTNNDSYPDNGRGSGSSFVRHHEDFNKMNNNPNNIARYSWHSHQLKHACSSEYQTMRVKKAWADPQYRLSKSKDMTNYNNKRWENHEEELHNHKVVQVEQLCDKEPVYNITVPILHNYALEAGIIVKNCEGDSAAGSAKGGRDVNTQAVLPIRGKIINAEKNDLASLMGNQEIQSLISAIGTGTTRDKEDFNIDNRRYNKIIIMTDADVDGSHISTLLITFFYRFMRPLVEEGHVYLAESPLYKIADNKQIQFVWTDKEKDDIVNKSPNKKYKITRFKGLGEMDALELGETTMKIGSRKLTRITVEDSIEADNILSVLMGRNVADRKAFIVEHSKTRNKGIEN